MRKKQIFAILIVLAFLNVATISAAIFATGKVKGDEASEGTPIELPMNDQPLDSTQKLKDKIVEGAVADTGNTWEVLVNDDATGDFYYQNFTMIFAGLNCNIWVGLDEDYDSYEDGGDPGYLDDTWYFSYPWTPDGYPDADYPGGYYLYPDYVDYITGAQLKYLVDEFDSNIHAKVTDWFGEYAPRPGPLGDKKIQILVFNILDEFFYSPLTAQGYIAGYFWGYVSDLNNANVFHMDTYQWWRRVGDIIECPAPYEHLSPLPKQYEGTLAHEFQHLVNYDVDRDEYSWVDEGCSTLAAWVCGYGFTSNIFYYIAYWWGTSLVIWDNYLENYGVVFLWTYYNYEHYGGKELIQALASDTDNGIQGWSNALSGFTTKTFDEIFEDWAIANYLDNPYIDDGQYGYYDFDIPSGPTGWWDIPYSIWYWEAAYPGAFDTMVDKYPNYGYPYPNGACLPYVVNYVDFSKKGASILEVEFDGYDYAGAVPYSGARNWHSDGTPSSYFKLGNTFDIPAGGATLTFWNFYSIELDWDYGYVEVYDHYDNKWTTLPGLTTTTYLYTEQDNPNCPGVIDDWGLEPAAYNAAGEWNAFTGDSPGLYQEVMDLSPFAGHTIDLYFTYWTDEYTLGSGWYLDDIAIPELGFFDNVEGELPMWNVEGNWYMNDDIIYNDYEVNFINILNLYGKKGDLAGTYFYISSMVIDTNNEEGQQQLLVLDVDNLIESYSVMVITNQPGKEHTFASSYDFKASVVGRTWRWNWFH